MGRLGLLAAGMLSLALAGGNDYRLIAESVRRFHTETTTCTAWKAHLADLWVTAAHCVPINERTDALIGEDFAMLLKVDRDDDLALYRLVDVTTSSRPLLLAKHAPEIGDAVVIFGYVKDMTQPATFFGHVMGGQIPKHESRMLLHEGGGPGSSGGPVLVDGKVVGVIGGGAQVPSVVVYAASHGALKKFLK